MTQGYAGSGYSTYHQKAKAKKAAPGIPANPYASLTPAQIKAQIDAQTQAAVAPERLAIQQQRAAAAKLAQQEQDRIAGFSQASAQQLGALSPALAQQYQGL